MSSKYGTVYYRSTIDEQGIRGYAAGSNIGPGYPPPEPWHEAHHLLHSQITRVKWLCAYRIDVDGQDLQLGYTVIPVRGDPEQLAKFAEALKKQRPDLSIDERNRYGEFDYQGKAMLWAAAILLAAAFAAVYFGAGH